jgi:protein FRA10AC1
MPPLNTVELPFAYEEHGERKSALVKVVLCGKCLKKLMWKREKEKEERRLQEEKLGRDSGSMALVLSGASSREEDKALEASVEAGEETWQETTHDGRTIVHKDRDRDRRSHSDEHRRRQKSEGRRRSSRSRSPERRHSHRHEEREREDRRRSASRR